MARILAVAVTSSVADELGTPLVPYGAAAGVLFRHSVAASHVAEVVRQQSPLPLGPELVTAALLHDMGTVILAELFDRTTLDAARLRHGELTDAERELIDVDHAELGAMLAQCWRLPDRIVQAIRSHHRPSVTSDDLARAVMVADAVSHDLLGESLGWIEEVDGGEVIDALACLGLEMDRVAEASRERLRRARARRSRARRARRRVRGRRVRSRGGAGLRA